MVKETMVMVWWSGFETQRYRDRIPCQHDFCCCCKFSFSLFHILHILMIDITFLNTPFHHHHKAVDHPHPSKSAWHHLWMTPYNNKIIKQYISGVLLLPSTISYSHLQISQYVNMQMSHFHHVHLVSVILFWIVDIIIQNMKAPQKVRDDLQFHHLLWQ